MLKAIKFPEYDMLKVVLGSVVAIGVAFAATPVMGCALESSINFTAFSVDHRGSIPIAIATRSAIDEGYLNEIPQEAKTRFNLFTQIRNKAIVHTNMLSYMNKSASSATSNHVPVTMLLTQSGAWVRFNDEKVGNMYHATPAENDEPHLLVPDTVYALILDDKMDVERAVDLGLIRVYNAVDSERMINSFSVLMRL
ncbi:hypothetical protein HJA72_000199 [Vibrio fluvialis]|nr:hypothetical protein [Vibrio fluvialis]